MCDATGHTHPVRRPEDWIVIRQGDPCECESMIPAPRDLLNWERRPSEVLVFPDRS